MNNLVKAIVFSVSTALVATSAFAAPQQNQAHPQAQMMKQDQQHKQNVDQRHTSSQTGSQQANKTHQNQSYKSTQHAQQKRVKPSHDWRVGQKIPSIYQAKSFHVDYKASPHLNKPSKNQQWIKVNNDYVLTNLVTHAIIKIIAG